LKTRKEKYKRLELPLLGKHQRDNACVAINIVECLREAGLTVSIESMRKGLKNVFWPGRFEIIKNDPTVIIDGAHNHASISALVNTMTENFKNRNVIVIFGVSQDKDIEPICEELTKITDNMIFTKANHPRARDLPGSVNVKEALEIAFGQCRFTDIILITGSLFVISEARAQLMGHTLCTN